MSDSGGKSRGRHTWTAILMAGLLAFVSIIVSTHGAAAAGVDDSANLFTPSTLQAAAQQIQTIQQQTGIAIEIVTVPSLNGQDIQSATSANLAKQSDSSVVIYVVRDKRQVAVGAKQRARQKISDGEQNGIRDAMLARFGAGDFDRGLLDGLSRIQLAAVSGPSGSPSGGGISRSFLLFVVVAGAVVLVLLRLLSRSHPGWLPAGAPAAWLQWRRGPAEPDPGETNSMDDEAIETAAPAPETTEPEPR